MVLQNIIQGHLSCAKTTKGECILPVGFLFHEHEWRDMRGYNRFSTTIRGKLFLLLSLVFVPIFITQAIYHTNQFATRRATELQANLELARAMAETFDELVHDIMHHELAIGIHLTCPHSLSLDEMNQILVRNNAEYPAVRNLAWIGPQGRILASSLSETIGLDVRERSYFDQILGGKEWAVTDLFPSQATGEPVFSIARGIRDERRQLLGIVVAVVSPDRLAERLPVERAGGGAITVIDREARAVFQYPKKEWNWEERAIPRDRPEIKEVLAGREFAGVHVCSRDGIERLAGIAPIRSIGWAVAAGRSLDAVMNPVKWQLIQEGSFFFLLTASVFIIALLISRSIETPIRRLRKHALALAGGDFENITEPCGSTELKDLAVAFESMAGQIKSREEALRQSEEKYRLIFNQAPLGVIHYDSQGRIMDFNAKAAQIIGVTEEAIVGFHTLERLSDPAMLHAVQTALDSKVGYYEGDYLSVLGGKTTPVRVIFQPLISREGSVSGFVGLFEDITERKRADEAIRESEENYRSLAESSADYIMRYDRDGRHLYVNPACLKVAGVTAEEFIGKTHREMGFSEEQCDAWEEKIRRVFETGESHQWEFQFDGAAGRVYLDWRVMPEFSDEGTVKSVLGISRDITERVKAEETLRLERSKLKGILDSMTDGVYIVNQQYDIEYTNPVIDRAFGEVGGRKCYEYFDGRTEVCSWCKSGDVFSGKSLQWEWFSSKTGRTYELLGTPTRNSDGSVSKLGIFRDISERKQGEEKQKALEAQLRHAQKMEAIGTLSGGIAHDFNNILTPILAYTEMALEGVPTGNVLRHDLEQVLRAADRAKDLVKQILAFTRHGGQELRPVRLSLVIKEALKLLRASLPATIEIRQNITQRAALEMALADPTQIHQVMMNLCTNAAHAMREKGGVLGVRLDNVDLDSEFSVKGWDVVEPGPYLRLSVSDTGSGIPEEARQRIFDPYFTTKGPNEGTGLGLAVVYGIVKSCKGSVHVYSEPEKGACFHVYFPRMEEAPASSEAKALLPLSRGTERILLIDDEKMLAEAATKMLEHLGYRVTTLTDSLEALAAFREHPDHFDLILTDFTMPHMTGVDLAGEVIRIRPDMPIILCTGFSEQITEEKAKALGIREYVMKPFNRRDMACTLRKALGGDPECS